MSIYVCITDNQYNFLTHLGSLDIEDITKLNKEAEKHNLDCLTFLDYVGENIFNHIQIIQISREIEILKKNTSHLKKTLDVLEKAINQMPINPNYYLRFSGV